MNWTSTGPVNAPEIKMRECPECDGKGFIAEDYHFKCPCCGTFPIFSTLPSFKWDELIECSSCHEKFEVTDFIDHCKKCDDTGQIPA